MAYVALAGSPTLNPVLLESPVSSPYLDRKEPTFIITHIKKS